MIADSASEMDSKLDSVSLSYEHILWESNLNFGHKILKFIIP